MPGAGRLGRRGVKGPSLRGLSCPGHSLQPALAQAERDPQGRDGWAVRRKRGRLAPALGSTRTASAGHQAHSAA